MRKLEGMGPKVRAQTFHQFFARSIDKVDSLFLQRGKHFAGRWYYSHVIHQRTFLLFYQSLKVWSWGGTESFRFLLQYPIYFEEKESGRDEKSKMQESQTLKKSWNLLSYLPSRKSWKFGESEQARELAGGETACLRNST